MAFAPAHEAENSELTSLTVAPSARLAPVWGAASGVDPSGNSGTVNVSMSL